MSTLPYVNPFNIVVPLQPDFDTIFNKVQIQVTNDGSITSIWTDAITAATGSYITRMVSSFTADMAFLAERVQHEVFLGTARRPSSVYAITNDLGVHISRKVPGSVEVRLARATQAPAGVVSSYVPVTAAKSIPAYTQWSINGLNFFNRNTIIFAAGISLLTVTLYRGTIQTDYAYSTGSANQSFIIDTAGFAVSDVDLFCIDVNNLQWSRIVNGLWQQSAASRVFFDKTQSDGSVRIDFGDSVYGAIMPTGTFSINYVVVQVSSYDAAQDLNPVPLGSAVVCSTDTTIAGLTLGALSAIQPEKPPSFYQKNAPYISSGQKQGNTRDNLTALALAYPNVIDARLLGQAEMNPSDLRWMTGIACCLLTSTTWATSDWNQFISYMQTYSDSTRHFYRYDPTPVTLNYAVTGTVVSRTNIAATEALLTNAIYNPIDPVTNLPSGMLMLQQGSLGASYSNLMTGNLLIAAATDPYGGLLTSLGLQSPINDPVLTPMQYAIPGTISVKLVYDPKATPKIVNGTSVPGGRIGLQG